jgi:hypothetical protein
MLRLCLVAVFAMGVATLSIASPALAKKSLWSKMEECPFGAKVVAPNGEEVPTHFCTFGEAGPESFYQAGKVTIHFVKPVDLYGGIAEVPGAAPGQEDIFITPRNGVSISKEAEPGPSLTELDAEDLAEPEKARYEKYLASGKSTATTETVELAKPNLFLSLHDLFAESGPTFGFSIMIHIQNPFLGKECYDGTTVTPIEVPFTTGTTSPPLPNTPIEGEVGEEGEPEPDLDNAVAKLVDNEYAAPGVSDCGVNGGADAAVDAGLGLPSPAGNNTTELIGKLWITTATQAEKHIQL